MATPAPEAPSPDDSTIESPEAEPAPRKVAEPPPPAAAIPARFLGTWDSSAAACAGPPGEMRLVVEPDRLRFHESVARVEVIRPAGEDRVEADLAFQGEGERWRETRAMRLISGGRLAVDAAGPPAERVRCE